MPFTAIRKYKIIIATFTVTGLIITLIVYFAPYGIRNYLNLRNEINKLSNEIHDLKEQNKQLNKDIELLKTDSEYIEEVARKQFGLLKKNEIVFDFEPKKRKKK